MDGCYNPSMASLIENEEYSDLPYTNPDMEAARKRLLPFLKGYPSPMIDARKLRMATKQGTAQDHREISCETKVIADWRSVGIWDERN